MSRRQSHVSYRGSTLAISRDLNPCSWRLSMSPRGSLRDIGPEGEHYRSISGASRSPYAARLRPRTCQRKLRIEAQKSELLCFVSSRGKGGSEIGPPPSSSRIRIDGSILNFSRSVGRFDQESGDSPTRQVPEEPQGSTRGDAESSLYEKLSPEDLL